MVKAQRNEHGCRIDALPDILLHHVLSFLDMKHVVQTALLSRKWRYFWTTLRTLSFDYSLWKIRPQNFNEFVENVLLLRDGSSPNKLEIVLLCNVDMERINKWLIMASRKHIPKVSLRISTYSNTIELITPLIFTSPVKVIEIESPLTEDAWPRHNMLLPNALCTATHLKTLCLNSVKLPMGDSKREVTLKCLVLEKLILENCYYAHLIGFNISIPQLKVLTVKNVDRELVKLVGSCKIRISTPNLTTLWLKCCPVRSYVIEKCDSLVSAKVEVAYGTLLCDEGKASLDCLKNVTRLELSDWTLKICLDFQDILDQIPNIFCNLRSLTLTRWPQPSCIRALASLLSRSINIEHLVLEFIQENSNATIAVGDIEKMFSFQCRFYHLKSVEVQNFTGCKVEMELLESVLKNAFALEELTVVVHPRANTRQGLKEYMRKIQALPRASSHAIILVLQPGPW